MQFKVPQNVQIEDKILPFMTLRQLIICGIGGGFAYMLYIGLQHQNPEIWIPPVAVVSLLTVAIAFLKIQDILFVPFVLLALERYLNEQKRIWIKSAGDIFIPEIPVAKKESKKNTNTPRTKISELEKLSQIADSRGQTVITQNMNTSKPAKKENLSTDRHEKLAALSVQPNH